MKFRIFLLTTCVVCGLGLIASGSKIYASRQIVDRGEPIPQPAGWVSFAAQTLRVAANGQIVDGYMYRGADSSELFVEFDRKPDKTIEIRHIENYTKGRYYHSTRAGEWVSGPLVVPGPRRRHELFARTPSLRPYQGRLALLAGQDGSLTSLEGLEAWISTTQEGSVHLLAPALNFFPVVSNSLNGQRRVVSQIKIGPVPASYFEPPSGDQTTEVAETFPPKQPPQHGPLAK